MDLDDAGKVSFANLGEGPCMPMPSSELLSANMMMMMMMMTKKYRGGLFFWCSEYRNHSK